MHDLLNYISNICIALSLLLAFMYRQYLLPVHKLLAAQLFLGLLAQVAGEVYLHYSDNNTFIFNIYIIFNIWMTGIVAILLEDNRIYKRTVIAGLCICTLITATCIGRMGIHTIANWGFLSGSIVFTIAYLYIFIKLLLNNTSIKLMKQPVFWICTGQLLYFGCNVPLFGFLNYLINYHPAIAIKIFNINIVLSIILYTFTGIAFLLQKQYSRQAQTANI